MSDVWISGRLGLNRHCFNDEHIPLPMYKQRLEEVSDTFQPELPSHSFVLPILNAPNQGHGRTICQHNTIDIMAC